jgi:hypothetical protein
MTTEQPLAAAANRELSSYFLRSGKHVAMCFAIANDDTGECRCVSLGVWGIATGGLIPPEPAYTLSFVPSVLPNVRRLVATALATLPHAHLGGEGDTPVLAVDGVLACHGHMAPDGSRWFTLGTMDGKHTICLPMGEAGHLHRLLVTAEEELVSLGTIDRPSTTMH